jgi:sodium transport system ATP-binding protein
MIEVRNLHKSFRDVHAVRGVDFAARDHCITGLLGSNGAGKSTTLRILSTVIRPDEGSVEVNGIDALAAPLAARRALGVMPHSPGLYPRLTARENIRYYGRLQGLRDPELSTEVDRQIGELGITDFASRRAKELSHGQATRVALARAVIHAPQNVLLDEPTNGLDVVATRALRDQLRGMRDAGQCIVLSSHVMQEVSAVCDEIVILSRGRVVASGSADELRTQMATDDLEEAFVRAITPTEGVHAETMGSA